MAKAFASMAVAVLNGADPNTVGTLDPVDHPAFAKVVREYAFTLGLPVPAKYEDRDTIADLIGADPREVDISAADADDHHAWAREHGLADDEIAYGDLDPDTALDPEADIHPNDFE